MATHLLGDLMKLQKESGHIILLALIALSLGVIMMQSAHERALHLLKTWLIRNQGRHRYSELVNSTPLWLAQSGRCVLTQLRKYPTGILDACYEELKPVTVSPPVPLPPGKPDYDGLFKRSGGCPTATRLTAAGTFKTPVAHSSCVVSAPLTTDLILRDNIVAETVSWSTQREQEPFVTVASPGYISITGALVVPQSILIVAGGAISIGSILTDRHLPLVVTIISAQGAIEVQSISGPISLVVVGTDLIRAPLTSLPGSFPFPLTRAPALLTLSAH